MDVTIEALLGKTLTRVQNNDDEEIVFEASDGSAFRMYHRQDCCEHVTVDQIAGDLSDLIGAPILFAEEASSEVALIDRKYADDSATWTFYKLTTRKGWVDIRWFGSSNGYYSESVDIVQTRAPSV